MAPRSQPGRRGIRGGIALVGVLVLAAVGLLLVNGSDDDGDPSDPPDGVLEVEVPPDGFEGTGVVVYGHSWSAPAGWHSPGRHWSQLLSANTDIGQLANFGIGGTTMEEAANLVTGAGRGAWKVTPEDPIATIVMATINSALEPAEDGAGVERSEESLRAAVHTIAARILSDEYAEGHAANAQEGTWTTVDGELFAGGSIQRATSGSVTFTVPDGVDGRMLWMATLAGDESVTYEVARDGVTEEVDTPVSEAPEGVGFTKWFLPVGEVDVGDEITVRNVTGEFFFDGMYLDSGKGVVAFTTEPARFESSFYPTFNDEELIDAHNEVVRDAVAELDELVPGGAALIDLDAAPGWNPTTMLFRDDEIHPDDTGQQWVFEHLAVRLREIIQESTRLDP